TIATAVTFCALLNVCTGEDTPLFSERRLRSVFSFEISRDRTNSVLDATPGTAAMLQVRWSPSFLRSRSLMQFPKFLLLFGSPREIAVKSVLSARFEIGTILTRTVNFGAGLVQYAPPEERFYLGGSNTVRGFPPNELGPVVRIQPENGSAIVSAIGGNFMVL